MVKKPALVIGATGFIGTYLGMLLQADGWNGVGAYDMPDNNQPTNLPNMRFVQRSCATVSE